MSTTAPLAVVTLAGFSTGIEPCAAAVWMSSGESAVAVVSPGDFGFAVGTGVSAKPSASSVWPTPRAPDPSPLATTPAQPAAMMGNVTNETNRIRMMASFRHPSVRRSDRPHCDSHDNFSCMDCDSPSYGHVIVEEPGLVSVDAQITVPYD